MKLLMHICCANCSLYPLQTFRSKGVEVKGYWFNPNIHPYMEYRQRLESLFRLQKLWGLEIEIEDRYGLVEFVRAVVRNEEERCLHCYQTRLDATARAARMMGMEAFTTSLLVSPYQKFDNIIDAGKEAAGRHGVAFWDEDFRTGWNEGVTLSKELGLYRQKYCGCIYSEMERYLGEKGFHHSRRGGAG
jgi:epoxyqueuosine reductase